MISVCIATHNASKYIQAQVTSILNQLASDDEIIIADDISTDNTVEIITNINDNRIKIIKGDIRLGIVKNFERALYVAKGNFIFLSDQDDIWLSTKVVDCVSHLKSNLLVVTDCIVVDNNLNILHESFFALRKSRKGLIRNLYKNSYIGCCMAFRKELLSYALPLPKNVPMHDIWLGMLAEIKGNVSFLPKQLLYYRRHSNNASPLISRNNIFKQIYHRIVLIQLLYFRCVLIFYRQFFKS